MRVRLGGLCRTSLPGGEGLAHAWLVGWWIAVVVAGKAAGSWGSALSRASCPAGHLSDPITPGVLPGVPCTGTGAQTSHYRLSRPGWVPQSVSQHPSHAASSQTKGHIAAGATSWGNEDAPGLFFLPDPLGGDPLCPQTPSFPALLRGGSCCS